MFVFPKVLNLLPSEKAQFPDQDRIRLISQLVQGILKVSPKVLNSVNGTAISVFIVPLLLALCKNFDLNLNDSESAISLSFGSSL